MAFKLSKPYVILCEGLADQKFFKHLIAARSLPEFDIPFPSLEGSLSKLFGRDSIPQMLRALSGDARGYRDIRGILIVVDSADDCDATHKYMAAKIGELEHFKAPPSYCTYFQHSNAGPGLYLMCLPHGSPGSLETLCFEAAISKTPKVATCLETFLACDSLDVANWSPEKRDKARLQCLIASTNHADPNKGLAYAFSVDPPIVDLRHSAFDFVADRIAEFCALSDEAYERRILVQA